MHSVGDMRVFQYDSCTEESLTRKRTYGPSAVATSWWRNRDGALRYDWPVKSINQSEGNFITNRQDLPVTEADFGPEYGVSGLCSSRFHIGKLICLGRSQGIFKMWAIPTVYSLTIYQNLN